MVDNNQMNMDTEYHPKEEDGYAAVPPPLGLPKSPITGRLKRFVIAGALILVVFFAYNFFSWYSAQKRDVPDKKQSLAVTQPQIVASDNANLMKNDFNDSARKQLDVLAQEVESNREQLAELSSSLIQSQQSIENLNKNVSALISSLQEIDKKIPPLPSKEIHPAVKKAMKANAAKKKMIVYHVKAIVPDRAWLESQDGDTVSVRVGDPLDGYGSVQAISPRQGIVVTSSAVIRYGNNDF